MKWKEFIQKYLPYSMYGIFAFILIDGFPSIYINRVGDYVSSQFVVPTYFIFCFVLVACFAKNKSAKKYKWMSSVISLLIIESFFFVLFLQYYFVTAILTIVAIALIAVLLYYQLKKLRPPKKRTDRFLKYCKDRTAVVCAYFSVIILIIPSAIGFYKEYIDVFSIIIYPVMLISPHMKIKRWRQTPEPTLNNERLHICNIKDKKIKTQHLIKGHYNKDNKYERSKSAD